MPGHDALPYVGDGARYKERTTLAEAAATKKPPLPGVAAKNLLAM